jgi:hypothetical protein
MDGDATSTRIYLLDEDDRQVKPDGPAVVGPDGVRRDLPPLVYQAVQHVIEAMQAGQAVKISPLRTELPIDDAAHAIGMRPSMLRKYVADGTIPFRSSEQVDWVRLEDVLAFDRERRRRRSEGVREILDEFPWDEEPGNGPPAAGQAQ